MLPNFSHVVSLFIYAAAVKALSNEEPVVHFSSSLLSNLETASGRRRGAYIHNPPLKLKTSLLCCILFQRLNDVLVLAFYLQAL